MHSHRSIVLVTHRNRWWTVCSLFSASAQYISHLNFPVIFYMYLGPIVTIYLLVSDYNDHYTPTKPLFLLCIENLTILRVMPSNLIISTHKFSLSSFTVIYCVSDHTGSLPTLINFCQCSIHYRVSSKLVWMVTLNRVLYSWLLDLYKSSSHTAEIIQNSSIISFIL